MTAFTKLRSAYNIKFIIGGHSSPESLPIAPLTKNQDVLLLSSITTSPKFTGISPHALRISPNGLITGELLANYALKKFKRVGIIAEETDYAMPPAEEFKRIFEQNGGTVVSYETFQAKELDFRSLLTKLKQINIDALYLATQSPDTAAVILNQLKELSISIPLFGNEQIGNLLAVRKDLANVFHGAIFAEPNFDKTLEKTKAFISRFKERYHVDELPLGIFTAEAYDAVRLLAESINKCGDTVEKVRECLLNTKDYEGASGTISFKANGDGDRKYVLKEVQEDGSSIPLFQQS